MLDARLRPLIDPPLERAAAWLAARGVAADHVTLAGFGLGLAAMAAIATGHLLPGLALLLANRVADGLDGAVARRSRLTDLGGFLDIVLDFILYAGIVFAFALLDPTRNALPAAFLLFSFMGTGSSFLAFAVMAAKRSLATDRSGRKSLYYLGGLTEGTETILFLVAACLWPSQFPALALAFSGLCWLTTLARIAAGFELLRDSHPPEPLPRSRHP